jgi:cytochrome c
MDSLDVNKACAAVLVAGIAFFVSGTIGSALVHEKPLKTSAIKIETAPPPGAGQPQESFEAMLVSADPKKGEADTKSLGCVACHSFNEGGKAGIGPNLYGVVGAPHGHMQGYDYSAALKGKQGPWNYAELNEWLTKPSAYAPGTKMSFAGIPDQQKRAEVIAYLRTLSANPEPLPAVPKAAAGAAGGGAGGATPVSFDKVLASADAKRGQADTMKLGCVACHSFNEGGKAGIGPNLYGVVGAPHGHMEGYQYSAALKGKQGPWTFDELNAWLTKPAAYAPGTKMTFAGVADEKERADVIAYLNSLSAKPEPLPKAE